MKRSRTSLIPSGIFLAALLGIAGCAGADSDAELDEVEQLTYVGNLGGALGSPVAAGSTSALSNDYQPTCINNSAAPDASYTWTVPSSGSYVFSTSGSQFDTVLEIRAYNTGASGGCNDDSNGTYQSTVTADLSAGQTVIVIIDGYGSDSGSYQLNINRGSSPPSAGMHLWLRADAGVTASGGLVSRWLDQSGNGRHASMNLVSRQPALASGALNGRPVIRFNGAQSMYLDIYAQPTTFTVFVVGKNSMPSESYSMILGPGSTSPNNQLRWENGSQVLFVGLGNNMPIITSSIGNTRAYHALSARYNGSVMNVYRDGNTVSSHSFTTTGPWTLASVGSWLSSYYMQGDLAEVILYDRALSETERASVNEYLRSKYFN